MKKILVLTDFSHNAYHAARYAISLAPRFGASNIIIYNSFAHIEVGADGYLNAGANYEVYLKQSEFYLANLKELLTPQIPRGLTVKYESDQRPLMMAVEEICADSQIDMIVVGSKAQSFTGNLLFGSSVTSLIKNATVPILVVPLNTKYENLETAIFATDLKETERENLNLIHSTISPLKLKLHIVNVNTREHEHADTASIFQQNVLHDLMDDLNPEFHYISDKNVQKGLENFANINPADLIILVHRHHGFFYRLVNNSTANKLALSLQLPVLIFPG